MDKLVILNRENFSQTYTFNELFEEINTDDSFMEFLVYCRKSKDCIKLGEYLDIFYKYLCDIIDEADYFYIYTTDIDLYNQFLNNLGHERYYENAKKKYKIDLFNIKNSYSKKWLKENLTFNISDEDQFSWAFDLEKSYLANDEKMEEFNSIYFMKDGNWLVHFSKYSGYIWDFRDNDIIEKHKAEYRKE